MAKRDTKKTKKQTVTLNTSDVKLCVSCGRSFGYQKRWEKTWESVRYCSVSCRRDKFEKRDGILEENILSLLKNKHAVADLSDIDQNDIEKLLDLDSGSFKNFKERTRRAARRLVAKDKIDILQKGRVVDASRAKGPIEVRLK